MIFAMARRMLVWDEAKSNPTPRWHPHAGISDVNPAFRTESPIMSSQGYAGTIWRNVRKRNKPSLWRHALRTYDRMRVVETTGNVLKIEQTAVHHEGAMLACAKLGLWKEALQIYLSVEKQNKKEITDNMILSLIKACVRGCKKLDGEEHSLEERRIPLDEAFKVLETIDENHGIPLVSRHLNPLAAAYQNLGLLNDANSVIQKHLQDRTAGPEAENGMDPLNVNDICSKDKASYALLVRSAVSQRDWAGAVEALEDMTESGLHPNARHVNSWAEVSERKRRQRKTRSWKKKRNEYWLESVK